MPVNSSSIPTNVLAALRMAYLAGHAHGLMHRRHFDDGGSAGDGGGDNSGDASGNATASADNNSGYNGGSSLYGGYGGGSSSGSSTGSLGGLAGAATGSMSTSSAISGGNSSSGSSGSNSVGVAGGAVTGNTSSSSGSDTSSSSTRGLGVMSAAAGASDVSSGANAMTGSSSSSPSISGPTAFGNTSGFRSEAASHDSSYSAAPSSPSGGASLGSVGYGGVSGLNASSYGSSTGTSSPTGGASLGSPSFSSSGNATSLPSGVTGGVGGISGSIGSYGPSDSPASGASLSYSSNNAPSSANGSVGIASSDPATNSAFSSTGNVDAFASPGAAGNNVAGSMPGSFTSPSTSGFTPAPTAPADSVGYSRISGPTLSDTERTAALSGDTANVQPGFNAFAGAYPTGYAPTTAAQTLGADPYGALPGLAATPYGTSGLDPATYGTGAFTPSSAAMGVLSSLPSSTVFGQATPGAPGFGPPDSLSNQYAFTGPNPYAFSGVPMGAMNAFNTAWDKGMPFSFGSKPANSDVGVNGGGVAPGAEAAASSTGYAGSGVAPGAMAAMSSTGYAGNGVVAPGADAVTSSTGAYGAPSVDASPTADTGATLTIHPNTYGVAPAFAAGNLTGDAAPPDAPVPPTRPASLPPTSDTVRGLPEGGYYAGLHNIEQGVLNGQVDPNNPTHYGPAQFDQSTWAGVRRNNPDLGLPSSMYSATPTQYAAATVALTRENQAALQAAGIPATPVNTYLAHNLGAPAAIQALRAGADASIGVISSVARAANQALYGGLSTIGQVQSRIAGMMSGPATGDAAASGLASNPVPPANIPAASQVAGPATPTAAPVSLPSDAPPTSTYTPTSPTGFVAPNPAPLPPARPSYLSSYSTSGPTPEAMAALAAAMRNAPASTPMSAPPSQVAGIGTASVSPSALPGILSPGNTSSLDPVSAGELALAQRNAVTINPDGTSTISQDPSAPSYAGVDGALALSRYSRYGGTQPALAGTIGSTDVGGLAAAPTFSRLSSFGQNGFTPSTGFSSDGTQVASNDPAEGIPATPAPATLDPGTSQLPAATVPAAAVPAIAPPVSTPAVPALAPPQNLHGPVEPATNQPALHLEAPVGVTNGVFNTVAGGMFPIGTAAMGANVISGLLGGPTAGSLLNSALTRPGTPTSVTGGASDMTGARLPSSDTLAALAAASNAAPTSDTSASAPSGPTTAMQAYLDAMSRMGSQYASAPPTGPIRMGGDVPGARPLIIHPRRPGTALYDPRQDLPVYADGGAVSNDITDGDPNAPPLTVHGASGSWDSAGDSSAAVGRGMLNGVPVLGPYIAGGADRLAAGVRSVQHGTPFADELANVQRFDTATAAASPIANAAGEFAGGTLGSAAILPAEGLGLVGGLGARLAGGAFGGGALGAADSYERGQDPLAGGVAGGAMGAGAAGLGMLARGLVPDRLGHIDIPEAAAPAAEVTPPPPAPQITVYHGSPHSFDRFDLSKIGTGEGAQAYGYGLYFAENEGVAKSYRDNLAGDVFHFDAKSRDEKEAATLAAEYARSNNLKEEDLPKISDYLYYKDRDGDLHSAFNEMIDDGRYSVSPAGHMYEVAIKADPERFLDWDKPLSEQHPAVLQALSPQGLGLVKGGPFPGAGYHGWVDPSTGKPVGPLLSKPIPDDWPVFDRREMGSTIYNTLSSGKDLSKQPEMASQRLRDAGITGIKYLDQGSRAGDGPGTKNYVVFDDKQLEILRKYGLAGLMASGAAGLAASQQQQRGISPSALEALRQAGRT